MNKHRIWCMACGLVLFQAVPVYAVTQTGFISARVVDTVSVLSKSPLVFGYIEPGSAAGTVTVTTTNKRQTTGKVKILPGLYERAKFVVRGTPNRPYTMHVPTSLTFKGKDWLLLGLFSRGKVKELTVNNFTTRSDTLGRDASVGRFDRKGKDEIYLGGTLIVPKDVAPGIYSGLVPITVSY